MLPRVIIHNAVSVDGRTAGFDADLALYYRLAGRWNEDVTLAGSDTILAALREHSEPAPEPAGIDAEAAEPPQGGLLAAVDSRGRIKNWRQVKRWPFWSRHVSLSAAATPQSHLAYLRYQDVEILSAGERSVELRVALEELHRRYDARTVRVESGGRLNAALLQQGLVDEVSLVVHPVLTGGMSPPTIFRSLGLPQSIPLHLVDCAKLDGGHVWLLYEVQYAYGPGLGTEPVETQA